MLSHSTIWPDVVVLAVAAGDVAVAAFLQGGVERIGVAFAEFQHRELADELGADGMGRDHEVIDSTSRSRRDLEWYAFILSEGHSPESKDLPAVGRHHGLPTGGRKVLRLRSCLTPLTMADSLIRHFVRRLPCRARTSPPSPAGRPGKHRAPSTPVVRAGPCRRREPPPPGRSTTQIRLLARRPDCRAPGAEVERVRAALGRQMKRFHRLERRIRRVGVRPGALRVDCRTHHLPEVEFRSRADIRCRGRP